MRTIFFALTFLYSLPLFAATNTETQLVTEEDFFADLPVVLAPTRLAQPIAESPVAVTLIDRQMIEASGARNIPDVLRIVPGFQVGYMGGDKPIVTYHGHGDEYARRLQVLIDGRPVYIPSHSGVPWSELALSLDDIDHIEVIRGPNASTYGPNSFLAVVSIVTRHPIQVSGHSLSTEVGSHETADGMYRFSDSTDNLDYRVTLQTQNDNGTDNLNDSLKSNMINVRADYQFNNDQNLLYEGGLKRAHIGIFEGVEDHNSEDMTFFQQFRFEQTISDKQSYSLQYYYNLHNTNRSQTYTDDLLAASAGMTTAQLLSLMNIDPFAVTINLDVRAIRHDLEFNYHLQPSDTIRLVLGASARLDQVKSPTYMPSNAYYDNKSYRAFGHMEWRMHPDWILDTGVLVEHNDISGTDVEPMASIIHHINNNNTLRLSASKATRTPVLFEEIGETYTTLPFTLNGQPLPPTHPLELLGLNPLVSQTFVSSGNLDSEEIVSYELGYIGEHLNKSLHIDIKAFRENISKLIDVKDVVAPNDNFDHAGEILANTVAILTGTIPRSDFYGSADDRVNADKSIVRGFEGSASYRAAKDWRMIFTAAFIDINAPVIALNPRTASRLEASAPKQSFGLMLIKSWPSNIDTSLVYYNVGDMDWLNRTRDSGGLAFKDRSADPYQKLDIKISKSFKYENESLQLSLMLQNLLEDYYDYSKTSYTDASKTVVANPGSLQDKRAYFEVKLNF